VSLIADVASRAGSAAQSVWEASGRLVQPSLRLGVTGLARSGKTVFTTAVVHHLTRGTNLPAFRASAEGRIRQAQLAHQPDDDVPRFPYEEHLEALTKARRWPASTTQINELRVVIDYERTGGWRSGPASLALDIVDYPGEWLLDLALLDTSYADWSREVIQGARRPGRAAVAEPWLAELAQLDPGGRQTKGPPPARATASRPTSLPCARDPKPWPPRRRDASSCPETSPDRRP
jgi:predicted YcjX-like family ATPase